MKLMIPILAVLALCLAPGLVLAGLNDGLVAHYCLEGDASDSGGNGHDGAVRGALPAPDRFGVPNRALEFDGIDDQIKVPYSEDFDLTSWTLAVWIRITAYPDDVTGVVIGKPARNINYDMQIAKETGILTSGFEDCSGNGVNRNVRHDHLRLNVWYFVAATKSSVSPFAEDLYVCDIEGGLALVDREPFDYVPCTESPVILAIGGANVDGTDRYFKGMIDEVWVYSRPLSICELCELSRSGPAVNYGRAW